MGTDKRARQKANREAKKAVEEAEAKVEQRSETTRRVGTWVAVAAAIVAIFVLYSIFTGGDDDESSDDTISFGADDTELPTAVAEPVEVELAAEVPADFEPFGGTGALSGVDPSARNGVYAEAPPMSIDEGASYAAVLSTDAGTIRLELFADEAPIAVNNFVSLARDGFYDGTVFHEVVADSLVAGGDPLGDGTGGPGYTFDDEVNPARLFDERGRLAMATDGPDANGSRFFITLGPAAELDGEHTIFGQLVGDDTVLDDITPTGEGDPTVIESVRIIEG